MDFLKHIANIWYYHDTKPLRYSKIDSGIHGYCIDGQWTSLIAGLHK